MKWKYTGKLTTYQPTLIFKWIYYFQNWATGCAISFFLLLCFFFLVEQWFEQCQCHDHYTNYWWYGTCEWITKYKPMKTWDLFSSFFVLPISTVLSLSWHISCSCALCWQMVMKCSRTFMLVVFIIYNSSWCTVYKLEIRIFHFDSV